MKFWFPLVFLVILASCSSPLEKKLRELDGVIERRGEYNRRYVSLLDSLRSEYCSARTDSARLATASELYRRYRFYQIDSSYKYLNAMSALGSDSLQSLLTFYRTEVLISMRKYDDADAMLQSVDTSDMNPAQKAQYYHSCLLLYANMAVDEFLPESRREEMLSRRHAMRLKYIATGTIDDFERVRRTAIQMYEDGNPDAAIPIFEKLFARCKDIHQKEDVCYSLANAYLAKNDEEQAMYWFAQSSIYSVMEPNRVYLSLYELARMLLGKNEAVRASSYIRIAIEDALACNYTPRLFNFAASQLEMALAVDYKNKLEKTILSVAISVFIILLLVIIWLLHLSRQQSRKLHRMYKLLEESDKIKEGYVSKYIVLSAGYLGLIEEFRHDLRVAMKKSDTQAVNRLLRDPRYYEGEFRNFYRIFDETFLGIYPDFVEKVNSLLKEDCRFEVRKGGELPTVLRILAAIKLGMKESGRIAEFLSCAPSSVYTHRCKIKKMALCPPEEFETRVSEL